MINNILKAYIKTSIILKLAKLNDDQYMQIYKNPYLKQKLDDKDLLNLFYQALPEETEKEIQEFYIMYEKEQQIKKTKIEDPEIIKFIELNKNKYFDKKILVGFDSYIRKREEMTGSLVSEVEFYLNRRVTEIIYDYIDTPNANINIIKKFIEEYNNLLNYNGSDEEELQNIYSRFFNVIYNISAYIYTAKEIYNINFNKTKKALELRQSNIFDFVLQNQQTVPVKHKKEQDITPEKTSVKIDYTDEATKK